MKNCSGCSQLHPLSAFYICRKKSSSGHQTWCKECASKAQKEYRERDPARHRSQVRRSQLVSKYSITSVQYDELLQKQGKCCAICKRPASEEKRRLAVDHDHETQEIRGLLCMKCNRGLGLFNDSSALLIAATEYLK